jgi:proline dehydrogenase
MLRSILIYLSKAEWMRSFVMKLGIARKVASRFVAGETLDDAVKAIRILNDKGMMATMDQLGENTLTVEDARNTGTDILEILDTIEKTGITSGISVKLTQMGLLLDENLCIEIMETILARAHKYGNFVRIDMEDSGCVDKTMQVYNALHSKGFANVGMVMQSYLFRAEEDTRQLVSLGCPIRMVKGAYKEPPEIAYPKKKDVDTNFDHLMDILIDAEMNKKGKHKDNDRRWPPIPAAGTHDEKRISHTIAYAKHVGLPKMQLEFQMLHGIRRDLQEKLVAEGYPVRIYVPFGTQWYPYFMRRLAERPANLWFFVSALFRT